MSAEIDEKTSATEEPLISKEEISRRLNQKERTIQDWMRRGWLPYYKIGRSVRFNWPEVKAHLGRNHHINGL